MPICKLCLKEAELKNSHLIPKSAYRLARMNNGSKLIRVDMENKSAFYEEKQVVAELLCNECEQLISARGENSVAKVWYRGAEFKLLETLQAAAPFASIPRGNYYAPFHVSKEMRISLFYFAVSVFWRASVWPVAARKGLYVGALGDKYEKNFRGFLLGQSTIKNTRLFVSVNTNINLNRFFSLPVFKTLGSSRIHQFDVLGLSFWLVVGRDVPDDVVRPFDIFDDDVFFMLADLGSSPDFISAAKKLSKVKLRGKLAVDRGSF
ncbi:hypothetical protein [Pseudomonas yamanorum]